MVISPSHPHSRSYRELDAITESVAQLLARRAAEAPSQILVVDGDLHLTTTEFEARVAGLERTLLDSGVAPGDVLSAQLPNWWEMAAVAHAAWRVGAVLNPVTPIYRGSELSAIFAAARPALVVTPGQHGGIDYALMARTALAEAGLASQVMALRDGNGHGDDVTASDHVPTDSALHLDDIALLMFTSGTTGVPKGVLHSQRTLLYEAQSIASRFELRNTRVFMPSPLTHITGLLYGILLPLLTDGMVVLLDRWDPKAATVEIERHGCTFCVGATPFLAGLVADYRRRGGPSLLDWFVCGGADVPAVLVEEAQAVLSAGVVRAYGLTELPTLTCGSPDDPIERRQLTDGSLVSSSQARIVNEVDGVGDLEVHGPEQFLGYLNPADNADAFTADDWFRTGDLARMDGRYVTIAGRRKDVIVRGGENISAKEVEDLILGMPTVAAVAIVGVPDSVLGERACAVVVPDGMPPSLTDIAHHLEMSRVARQKFPEHLLVVNELPRTASGKVQKYLLRALAAERLSSGDIESR